MIKYDVLILHSRYLVTRKEHTCYSCGKPIKKNTKCLYLKLIHFDKKGYFSDLRRHLGCPDKGGLIHINTIRDQKEIRKSIRRISHAGSFNRVVSS